MKAFPRVREHLSHEMQDGMDLRDYFAAQAPEVPSLFPRKEWSETIIMTSYVDGEKRYTPTSSTKTENWLDYKVRWCYAWADAMIEARKNDH
jgi:hypothetical protein